MNIVDVVIILLILMGAVIGFKNGFTKQLVSFFGFLIVIVLSFVLKNGVSVFLYEHLPFFSFWGILKGVTVLNIILYEVIAFLLVFSILMVIFRLVLTATSIFESILKMTIVLGIPSQILGAIVGALEYFLFVFVILYALSLPIFGGTVLNESKLKDKILKSTPILSSFVSKSFNVVEEFKDLKTKYDNSPNVSEFNKEVLELLLKYDVITVKSTDKLISTGKLKIDNVETILVNHCKENPTKKGCENR